MQRRFLRGKKLLIASAGLATVTFMGCPKSKGPDGPPGNLMPPPEDPPVAVDGNADGEADGAADGTTKPDDAPPAEPDPKPESRPSK